MIRRLSTKWVLSVLAIGVLPFLGFAWFTNVQMGGRLWDVVRYYLQSIAADLAEKVDDEIRERRLDVEQWAGDPLVEWAIEGSDLVVVERARPRCDAFIEKSFVYDLLLVVDTQGRYVVSNTRDFRGVPFSLPRMADLRAFDYSQLEWFQRAISGEIALVDHHVSTLVPPRSPGADHAPENYQFGFAVPVRAYDPNHEGPRPVLGVVYGLVNWGYIQTDILKPERGAYFQGFAGKDIYSSAYAWLWKSDGNTIIGHPRHELYGNKVSEPPVGLPQLVEAANSAKWGMYPEYEFGGEKKNAAFRHCADIDQGGFGWVVGIGIDNEDVFATVDELRTMLLRSTVLVLFCVVLVTIWIARRTTAPIVELQGHAHRVAAGDLETRIPVRSEDEVGQLARAFNEMTSELAASREQTVRAEKEAAWREMARQVAHEIKNPLTPISLSVNLLLRARRENSPEFDSILERTVELVQRQVDSMREIAQDFAAFAGARLQTLQDVDIGGLVDELLALEGAWAAELGVELVRTGDGGAVRADRGELRRVFLNLLNNAFEAMPDGGKLCVDVLRTRDDEDAPIVRIEIRDTGEGLTKEARSRLFEPYFTTRSHGTGLGLAIAKRVVDELGGRIELLPGDGGRGTTARIELPLAPDDAA